MHQVGVGTVDDYIKPALGQLLVQSAGLVDSLFHLPLRGR